MWAGIIQLTENPKFLNMTEVEQILLLEVGHPSFLMLGHWHCQFPSPWIPAETHTRGSLVLRLWDWAGAMPPTFLGLQLANSSL